MYHPSWLIATIKAFGVLPAHLALILDRGTVLVSVPLMICASLMNCPCTGR